MSIYIGNNKYKEIYLGSTKISEVYLGSNKIFSGADPYNPLNLPANTVRVRTSNGNAPKKVSATLWHSATSYETATLVSGTTDVYDVYKSGTSLNCLLYGSNNVVEVLGANTTGITDMSSMFGECTTVASVPLFDTSSVTAMDNMFYDCFKLTSVPLFDTSNVIYMGNMFSRSGLTTIPLLDTSSATHVWYMFDTCTKVESGALALYNQMINQTNPPPTHDACFQRCGQNTTTGAAELAQIPTSWGGTAS